MPVILSFVAVGTFFLVAALIEGTLEGHSHLGNTLKSNRRNKRRSD